MCTSVMRAADVLFKYSLISFLAVTYQVCVKRIVLFASKLKCCIHLNVSYNIVFVGVPSNAVTFQLQSTKGCQRKLMPMLPPESPVVPEAAASC